MGRTLLEEARFRFEYGGRNRFRRTQPVEEIDGSELVIRLCEEVERLEAAMDWPKCHLCGTNLAYFGDSKWECPTCIRDTEGLRAALEKYPCDCVPALIREEDGVVVGAAIRCDRCRALKREATEGLTLPPRKNKTLADDLPGSY